jgi:hypothetical protein
LLSGRSTAALSAMRKKVTQHAHLLFRIYSESVGKDIESGMIEVVDQRSFVRTKAYGLAKLLHTHAKCGMHIAD